MTKKYKYGTKYERNLMTGKIRRLLDKNPNAGYTELKKIFGKVTRSIIVTFYKVYQDMFNRSGHLNRPRQYTARPNSIREKVVKYFKKHPQNTTLDAVKDLKLSWSQVHSAIYNLSLSGRTITYRRMTGKDREHGKALQIRDYFKMNPTANTQECAENLGINPQYVSFIVCRARQSGKLPQT